MYRRGLPAGIGITYENIITQYDEHEAVRKMYKMFFLIFHWIRIS